MFHQDNVSVNIAMSDKTFLVKYNIPVLHHPPYLKDLVSCDFYMFPKFKSALKGTIFQIFEAVKEKAARVMKSSQKTISSTNLNNEKFAWSVVAIKKGSILKQKTTTYV